MDEKKKIENDATNQDIEKKEIWDKDYPKKVALIKQKEQKENKEKIDEEYNTKISQVSSKKIKKQDDEDEEEIVNPKKKFIMNLIKFVIWLVLLFLSFQYLENHQAEKTSMVSGLQMIYERASIFVEGIVTWESKYLEDKYKLEKAYIELINTIKDSNCEMDETTKKSLDTKYAELKSIDIKTYKTKQQDYYDFFVVFNQLLKQKCN